MDEYTLLLVDDEEEVIQAILKKIDWKGLGFSVIGHAGNGVKALEMIEEFQPDVVMTDIKMPYMDRMELSKHIREEYSETKILIFTGFDEFEYAKEALHLEIEEYVLKPLNAAELTQVLTKLKLKLDAEISDKRNVEILQKYYMESLPFLQMNFYSSLIEGRIREEEIPKYLAEYRIAFTGPFFCCLVIHTSHRQTAQEIDHQLLTTSVHKQAKEYLGEQWKAKSFSYLDDFVVIVQLEHENVMSELTDKCDRFCRYARRIIGAVVTIGIGQVCTSVMELPKSYSSASEAVSYRVIYGTGRAVNIREIAPQETKNSKETNDAGLAQLFQSIHLGIEEDILKAADTYFEQVFFNVTSLQQHHIAVMELVSALYRFAADNDIACEEFSGEIRELYGSLLNMEIQELLEWLRDISLRFQIQIASVRYKSTRTFISKAIDYICSHYMEEELFLDRVCEFLGVSNSHFSSTFKKETGKSFITYLTDYRMEKAAHLLIETNEKSYMIARKVGYADPNYFSYVFKRKFGVAPSKYRTEYAESEKERNSYDKKAIST